MTLKEKHFIDIHKGVTGLFMLFLMNLYGTWENTTSWVYLGLHGTYGLLWISKSFLFPDTTRGRRKLPFGMVCTFGLV